MVYICVFVQPDSKQKHLKLYLLSEVLFQVANLDHPEDDIFLKGMMFTDECCISNDNINRHNEHHYSAENPHCLKVIHTQVRQTRSFLRMHMSYMFTWLLYYYFPLFFVGPLFCQCVGCRSGRPRA